MMKRKILIPVLAVMLCVGMIGVGFAAWVIAATSTTEAKDDSMFVAYAVDNRTVTYSYEFTDGEVNFGSKTFDTSKGATNYNWLTLKDDESNAELTNNEDLYAELTITITNWGDNENKLASETITFNLTAFKILNKSDEDVTSDYVGTYITMPTVNTITIDEGTLDDASVAAGITFNNGVLVIPLNFGWGSAFNNVNPNQYYNSQASTSSLISQADAALSALAAVNEFKFQVTISANCDTN
ncbi:MAG: hypothetical protein IJD75_07450 [Clostridia bacterium]|nr:hypothetical protein [Clostridia bacterium]